MYPYPRCAVYADVIARYDHPDTLFYLPPYYGNEKDYNAPFARDEFLAMAAQLAQIKGRFVLSLNDRPEVREIFSAFHIESVEVNYSISRAEKGRGKRGEVIIMN